MCILPNLSQGKWTNIAELKKGSESAQVPVTGDEAARYKAKWTDSKVGQVKFGGWKQDAYDRFEQIKEWIVNFRADQAKKKNPLFKYAKKTIRATNNITANAPGGSKKKTKKRKAVVILEDSARKITRIDE